MGVLFVLNQKELPLAIAEAKAFCYGWEFWKHNEVVDENVLHLPIERVRAHKFSDAKLGLSHKLIKVLAVCSAIQTDIEKTIESIDWKLHIKKNTYRVSLSGKTNISERDLAKTIWQLAGKNVDLSNPQTTIEIVITKKYAYIGLCVWTQEDYFSKRRAHLLPANHPSMMHPQIARAMAHFACAKKIHDSFCGAGGFLIEANLAGIHASGSDIEPSMLKRARINCASFGIRPSLRIADAIMWQPRVQAIVTDLPYGKSTRPVALQHLFEAFLLRASQSTSRVIIGMPSALTVPKGWTARMHMTSYVHKSMTKHFYVLEKD